MPLSGLKTWAKRPENKVKLVGAAVGVAVIGTIAAFAGRGGVGATAGSRGVPKYKEGGSGKGFVLCPKDVGKIPPSTQGLARGDFVIIELAAADRSFVEPTWARVRSFSPSRDKIYVEISGEYTQAGIKPLATDKHGFYVGERLVIGKDCIFDVLRSNAKFTGQILCGPNLGVILGPNGESIYYPVNTTNVTTSNIVRIVVASPEAAGTAWHEPLWVHVTTISPSQNVIRGLVAEQPQLSAQHGLNMYSPIEFGRDCVIDVSTPNLLGAS